MYKRILDDEVNLPLGGTHERMKERIEEVRRLAHNERILQTSFRRAANNPEKYGAAHRQLVARLGHVVDVEAEEVID